MTEQEEEKKSKLAKLEKELGLVERQLELIKLIDSTKEDIRREEQQKQKRPPTHEATHPVGTSVTFTSPNEKYRLRGKSAIVTGHSPKFVRVRRGSEELLRLPHNVTPKK